MYSGWRRGREKRNTGKEAWSFFLEMELQLGSIWVSAVYCPLEGQTPKDWDSPCPDFNPKFYFRVWQSHTEMGLKVNNQFEIPILHQINFCLIFALNTPILKYQQFGKFLFFFFHTFMCWCLSTFQKRLSNQPKF